MEHRHGAPSLDEVVHYSRAEKACTAEDEDAHTYTLGPVVTRGRPALVEFVGPNDLDPPGIQPVEVTAGNPRLEI